MRQHLFEPLERRQLLTVVSGFAETQLAGGMTRPVQMDFAPDGRLFITQQDGKLRVFKNGQLLSTPFLTVTTHNTGERGLLGIAIDPNFTSNKFIYVYYTKPDGSGGYRNRVSRFTANGDVAQSGSETVLIETDNLGTGTWHNSGGMRFGLDGKLYVGIGDNQQGSVAQSLTTLLGKVIRINADGSIPTDNPFYTQTTGKYRAIWARGFRNPFTLDVQPGTGRIFVNDVGAAAWEEINDLKKGANYGWPNSEGPTTNPAYTTPWHAYAHAGGDFDDSAITGAAFYNPPNPSFPSDYLGDYFFGDYGTGNIKRIDLSTKAVSSFVSNRTEITDVEIADDGSLYYLSRTTGQLFRVHSTTTAAPTIAVHPQSKTVSAGEPVTFSVSANGSGLSYQWQRNGSNISGATAASYTINQTSLSDNAAKFRVVVSNSAGSVTSNEASLKVFDNDAPVAAITSPTAGTLWVGGGTLSFAGTGNDAEDGSLPAANFTWRVDLHHDTHVHPFIPDYSGVTSDTIDIPTAGHDAEHNIWYRIHLTVRDSLGLTHTTSRDVFPQKIDLSLRTEPAGLQLTLDGAATATPYDSPAIVGFARSLAAPATQTLGGTVYAFDGWSDGNTSASRTVNIPASDVTYTARYKVSTQQTVALRASADAYVRDGDYANTNFGQATDLQAKKSGVGWNRDSYLTFDLGSVGAGVTSAKLKLFARLDNTLAPSSGISVYSAPTNWSESTITWNNKPAAGATLLGSLAVVGTTAKEYEVDLTSYFRDQKAAGATSAAIVLRPAATSQANILINSDENAGNKPTLTVLSGGGDPNPNPNPNPNPGILRALADAYVRDGTTATTNFGLASELQVKTHASAGYTRYSYLKFDLSTLPSITSAKLRLYGRLTEAASVQAGVYGIADQSVAWAESTLTWNARPAVGTTAAATAVTVSSTANSWYEWDVTNYLKAEKAAGRNVVTLVIKTLSQTNATLTFASDEASANRPELVVA